MKSLRARLLFAASIVLAAFFVLCGAALESAFRDSAQEGQKEKLEGLIYALLAAVGPSETGDLTISANDVPDLRLKQATSGLQAALFDEQGRAVWSSVAFLDLPPPRQPAVNELRFERLKQPDAFAMSYGLRFINYAKDPLRYTVVVIEDAASFNAQVRAYRRTLWTWLAGAVFGLLLVQYLVLRWGLQPLRLLVRELQRIEKGEQTEIRSEYPEELKPLTLGLNAMIQNERNQQKRYRNALGDLAHSLKTPLAVIRGLTEEGEVPAPLRQPLREQLNMMQQITDYQLRKAAAAGRRTLSEPVALRPILDKLSGALVKVYADKSPRFDIAVPPGLRLRADSGDLFELLGNLLDNAVKYGRGQVRVSAFRDARHGVITVEDDGPGFPAEAEDLLQRGVRADTQTHGQGIGLAVVHELVKAYEGKLELGRSEFGGGRVTVRLPT